MKKLTFDVADTFLVLIAANALLHYLVPVRQLIFSPYRYVGIILFILGWIPNIWIWVVYKRVANLTPSKETPQKLITSGLFRFSRNPNYLGMAIALFGEAVFLGSVITFAVPVLFVILVKRFNISFEEEVLEKKFGKKYLKYKKKVRRWI
jgi:protein-S-isoprenylcysteine O-methyltransferase Ste14